MMMAETAAINDRCNTVPEFPIYECPQDPKNPDFIALTNAMYLLSQHNRFNHLAHKWKALINAIAGQEGMPLILPILSAEE